jgi:hypothetical protein
MNFCMWPTKRLFEIIGIKVRFVQFVNSVIDVIVYEVNYDFRGTAGKIFKDTDFEVLVQSTHFFVRPSVCLYVPSSQKYLFFLILFY